MQLKASELYSKFTKACPRCPPAMTHHTWRLSQRLPFAPIVCILACSPRIYSCQTDAITLTCDIVYLIGPRSNFAIGPTGCRSAVLVKGLVRCSTGCAPSSILNCKHLVSFSHCSQGALCNGVLSSTIRSIENGIFSFQWLDGSIGGVFEAADGFINKIRRPVLKFYIVVI